MQDNIMHPRKKGLLHQMLCSSPFL